MKCSKMTSMAICYDFDGTLSPGNMQEYGFVRQLKMKPSEFWQRADRLSREAKADLILAYMRQMQTESAERGIPFQKSKLTEYGQDISLFDGLNTWFKRINAYGRKKGLAVEHYIISSGLKEILDGTPIAGAFKAIFASSFIYDDKGDAVWPALAVNFTNKTQFLFRINKGCLDVEDNQTINRRIPEQEKYMPFSRMIYIGDGETDVPCMLLLKNNGGHSVAVYQKNKPESYRNACLLLEDGRVDFVAPADYRSRQAAEKYVRALIDKIAADTYIENLPKKM